MADFIGASKGCITFNEECKKLIMAVNRAGAEIFRSDYKGSLALPIKKEIHKVTVEAGSHYIAEDTEVNINAIMSLELAEKLKPLQNGIIPNGKSCHVDSPQKCVQDQLTVRTYPLAGSSTTVAPCSPGAAADFSSECAR